MKILLILLSLALASTVLADDCLNLEQVSKELLVAEDGRVDVVDFATSESDEATRGTLEEMEKDLRFESKILTQFRQGSCKVLTLLGEDQSQKGVDVPISDFAPNHVSWKMGSIDGGMKYSISHRITRLNANQVQFYTSQKVENEITNPNKFSFNLEVKFVVSFGKKRQVPVAEPTERLKKLRAGRNLSSG